MTSWFRPDSTDSIRKASVSSAGLPMIFSSRTTTVSAPMKNLPLVVPATASAFSSDSRMTCSDGFSPGRTASLISAGPTLNSMPASAINSVRRGDADASTIVPWLAIALPLRWFIRWWRRLVPRFAGLMLSLHILPVLCPVLLADLQQNEDPGDDDQTPEDVHRSPIDDAVDQRGAPHNQEQHFD